MDAARGFGEKGITGPLGDLDAELFDPATITGACAGGDPTLSQSSQSKGAGVSKYGVHTWGYEGELRDGNGYTWLYKGLGEEESRTEKAELEAIADKLEEEIREKGAAFDNLLEEIKTAPELKNEAEREAKRLKGEKLDELFWELDQLNAEHEKAVEEARSDPNRGPPLLVRPSQKDLLCVKALQAAREVLRECHRVGWKSYKCQALQAKMNDCPDPALILVTAEFGYTCMATVDSEEVRRAYVAHCRELGRPTGPDVDPCAPRQVDHGRFLRTSDPSHPDTCLDPRA